MTVSYWPYVYLTDYIVAGLIAHSRGVFSFPVNTPELAAENWYNASALLGCGSEGDVMDCMRSLNLKILKLQQLMSNLLLKLVKQGHRRLFGMLLTR
jgi:hypothetical protein